MGAPGGLAACRGAEAGLGSEEPALFRAVTVKVYGVELVSTVTFWLVPEMPVTVRMVCPPRRTISV